MGGEHRDWTRHGVGRSLLWWPFLAFGLVAVFPGAGVLAVVGSGAGLALLGLVGDIGARMLRRRPRPAAPPAAAPVVDEPGTRAA